MYVVEDKDMMNAFVIPGESCACQSESGMGRVWRWIGQLFVSDPQRVAGVQ